MQFAGGFMGAQEFCILGAWAEWMAASLPGPQGGVRVSHVLRVMGEAWRWHIGFIGQDGKIVTGRFAEGAVLFRGLLRSRFMVDRENFT
jgi:hypothetical protein